MLKRKQSATNAEWLEAVNKIAETVSEEEISELTEKTVFEIRSKTAEKKCAYAWSAGKDSIVLGDICKKSGITDSMIAVTDLEYPAFMKWVDENKPEKCTVINVGYDIEWLSKHQNLIFPQDSATAAHWFSIVQHKAQRVYFKEKNLDIILLGRRKADGNYVGKGDNLYTDGKGVTRYSPLSEWSHEHLLAYIHYNKLSLPPIYGWKNGYVCGTHPWPARQWTNSIENGWREVYEIDKSIVEKAAEHIQSAKTFLGGDAQ